MEKRVEFILPEGIIQDIQSRMSGKEAAQTSLISKSWLAAWKTGSHLYFDQRRYYCCGVENEFWQWVCKTVQMYVKSKLRIDSLSLWMYDEVLGSDTLTRLSLTGCKIPMCKINCLRLKSLCLENVWVKEDFLRDIMSTCPLIDKLSLCICPFFHHGTKEPKICHSTAPYFFELQNLLCKFESIKLKSLSLCGFNVLARVFNNLSSKFPSLKELAVHACIWYGEIQISSPSLECISIRQVNMVRAKFDVPSIRKFILSSGRIPCLLFETHGNKWESDISIKRVASPSTGWFHRLSEFLTKLSMSRVSLSLKIMCVNGHMYVGNIPGVRKPLPVLENLSVNVPLSSVCPALFNCLFLCCRPVFVTPTYIGGKRKMEFMEVFHKGLLQQIKSNCRDDLEEVMVEVEDSLGWRTLLLDDSTRFVDGQRIRLHLKWGENAAAFQ